MRRERVVFLFDCNFGQSLGRFSLYGRKLVIYLVVAIFIS